MLIQQKEVRGKGKFYVVQEGRELAEMAYTMPSPDKMIIEHTEVNDELRGRNVGAQMVKQAVEYARSNNIKIIPLCPFAKSVFDRVPDIQDVLFQ
ncbi:MAG TPA: GNAT family N-acetyltransferase [Chitinophagaceae bacterium]|nr:GNAT family N-acetyltransferase [Chitinophagaceae bacterium]